VLAGALVLGVTAAAAASTGVSTTPGPAPGLTARQHTQLVKAGAFGKRPIRVLLLGDSIALTLGIGLAHGQAEYGLDIDNHSTLGCDLDPTLEIITSGKEGPATPGCTEWYALWPFLTAAVQPDVVVLGVGRWDVTDHLYQGQWVHIGDPIWDAHVVSDLQRAVAIFHLFGARVVLLTMPYLDPPNTQPNGVPWPENTPAYAQRYNQLVRQVAAKDPKEVTVVDLNKMLSPSGAFQTVVNGVVARWTDGVHVTIAGGEYLEPRILPVLDRLGLAAEPSVAAAQARAAATAAAIAKAKAKAQAQHHT
jgi:hypothetical protein